MLKRFSSPVFSVFSCQSNNFDSALNKIKYVHNAHMCMCVRVFFMAPTFGTNKRSVKQTTEQIEMLTAVEFFLSSSMSVYFLCKVIAFLCQCAFNTVIPIKSVNKHNFQHQTNGYF